MTNFPKADSMKNEFETNFMIKEGTFLEWLKEGIERAVSNAQSSVTVYFAPSDYKKDFESLHSYLKLQGYSTVTRSRQSHIGCMVWDTPEGKRSMGLCDDGITVEVQWV